MDRIEIDITTPAKWRKEAFWLTRRRRVYALVIAFSPNFFAVGVERISGYSNGAALMIGPIWLGLATRALTD